MRPPIVKRSPLNDVWPLVTRVDYDSDRHGVGTFWEAREPTTRPRAPWRRLTWRTEAQALRWQQAEVAKRKATTAAPVRLE